MRTACKTAAAAESGFSSVQKEIKLLQVNNATSVGRCKASADYWQIELVSQHLSMCRLLRSLDIGEKVEGNEEASTMRD